jgi:hypothetical protein
MIAMRLSNSACSGAWSHPYDLIECPSDLISNADLPLVEMKIENL